jgi:hypothetical protein
VGQSGWPGQVGEDRQVRLDLQEQAGEYAREVGPVMVGVMKGWSERAGENMLVIGD